jgi:site-specific DNA recombinase
MPSANGHGLKTAVLWAIIYARVSTDEQARSGYSLAQQIEACRAWCEREGYEVLEVITDPGQSGASLERPGLDRARDLIATGRVSVILAQDRDRFAREPALHYILKQELAEYECELRALNDRGDGTPEGELTDGILDQLAKYERAKMAERTRRGKRKKVRQGKILATHTADYGFRFNAARDGYEVDEEKMALVKRIFRWIGVEGWTIRRVRKALDDLEIEPPGSYMNKSGLWNEWQIRRMLLNDAYKPHSFEEIQVLLTPEVAANLDPEKSYGIWWWGKERHRMRQISERKPSGKVYKKVTRSVPLPKEEWVAVPVPDAGVPKAWVDAAREALKKNERPSFSSGRFWELSGGIVRCGCCGWAMATTTVSSNGLYYRCRKRSMYGKDICGMNKYLKADLVEPLVWEGVSEILGEPERLKRGLQKMLEREQEDSAVDHEAEAHLWREKLSEIERKRANFQELAAEGLMTKEELRSKLDTLALAREAAERELKLASERSERLSALESDAEHFLESYEQRCVEALTNLSSEERREVYKLLDLTVEAHPDGRLEAAWALNASVSKIRGRPRRACVLCR